jgi:effector-binding domain-containing protein
MSDFEFRFVPEQDTAVVTVHAAQAGIGEKMGEALGAAFEALAAADIVPAGPPFARYFSFGETIDFEAGVPLASPFAGTADVKAGHLGGGEAAVAMHVGPYDTLSETWEALTQWVAAEGREIAGPGFESYLTDPGDEPDASKWMTQVCLPVR